ncbi:MAG: SMI1/KNR4 family protein [Ginsengibacter sp.]
MQINSIDNLRQQLFDETDGSNFSKLKNKLLKIYAVTQRETVINIFSQYVKEGKILHWRNFLLRDIIDMTLENENKYAYFFAWTITVPTLTYWGIDGLLKTQGKDCYEKLIELLQIESQQVSIRAKAIKSISEFSKQTFDKGLPGDPGYWRVEDLKITEIVAWQQNGYPDGLGYPKPQIHPSIANPKTSFEKLISNLDKKLEKLRSENQDESNPSNWLIVAGESDMIEIEKKWQLPGTYLLFLKNYSPLEVNIDGRKFVNGLSLYGAGNLIVAQSGYSYNTETQNKMNDWPINLVVIGDDGGDPFCIDIDATKDGDAPIYKSMHGQGAWKFEKFSDSFTKFLKALT